MKDEDDYLTEDWLETEAHRPHDEGPRWVPRVERDAMAERERRENPPKFDPYYRLR